jgi:hypothetical protein
VYAQQDQTAGDGGSASASAAAAVPRLIKYSGVVRDARGEPVTSAAVRLTFAVYSEQQGGAALWIESQVAQLDEQGHYAVLLGATRADGLPVELFPAGKARWLGVQVEGRDEDARVLLVSVPYALKAEDAAMLGGRSAADFVLGEQLKEEVRTQVAAQTPGIATQAVEMLVSNPPKVPAIAEGPSTFTCATTGDCVAVTQSGTGRALRTTATSASETVLVQQNGTGYGLRALSPGNVALLGQVTGSAGTSYGVKGQTTSTTGAGVFGYNLGATGLAYGVLGQTASTEGTAFFGRAVATTGATIGLRGHADSTSGTGIVGQATAASGTTTGILGRVFSVDGTALIVDNTQGGKLLSGKVGSLEKFSVDGSGNVTATGSVAATGTVSGTQLASTVASGTAPFTVNSNTVVPSLNADLVDGVHAGAFPRLGVANEFTADQTVPNLTATGTVAGATGVFSGSNDTQIVSVTQSGSGTALVATGGSYGLYGSGSTYGVHGTSSSSTGYGVFGINTATSGDAFGVYGGSASASGSGVRGHGYFGTFGWSQSGDGYGVYGANTASTGNALGVYGASSSSAGIGVGGQGFYGVYGTGDPSGGSGVRGDGYYGVYGSGSYYGVRGSGTEAGVRGSGDYYGVYGSSTETGVYGTGGHLGVYGNGSEFGVYGSGPTGVYGNGGSDGDGVYGTGRSGVHGSGSYYGVHGSGNTYGVYASGNLGASGTKSAVVALPDDRVVELYAMESPELWFEDFGTGELSDGVAEVTLDPTFALTVNTEAGYHVFLTPNGDCEGLYVASKTAAGFEVRELRGGKSDVAFDYRIAAKRRGYESVRLEQLETDPETAQAIRQHAQRQPGERRKLVLPKSSEAPKAPPEQPTVQASPAASPSVLMNPLEPPRLPQE